jgi:hypothetical protein
MTGEAGFSARSAGKVASVASGAFSDLPILHLQVLSV